MLSGGDSPTDRILTHLAEIGAGRCTITDQSIVAEPDADMRQILLGLLVLHEDLAHAGKLRTEAEAALRAVADQRERALAERQEAVEARDQFLAVASHELRTPLTTMALLVDNFEKVVAGSSASATPLSTILGQQLPVLKRQVGRLTGLVVEMLDVSRITGRGLDIVHSAVDLAALVREVVDRFAIEAQRRRVRISMSADGPVPGSWDRPRLEQVVTNLISNAFKYGSGQPVEIEVRGEPGLGVVVVRDHGIGIPLDEQGKIFGPFARAIPSRHHAGLGLGLWIAQQIVRASGGRIRVDSRPDEGSTFTVELPR